MLTMLMYKHRNTAWQAIISSADWVAIVVEDIMQKGLKLMTSVFAAIDEIAKRVVDWLDRNSDTVISSTLAAIGGIVLIAIKAFLR